MPTTKGSPASTPMPARGWTTTDRYYDPALGQFTSADTVGGLNRYGYTSGTMPTAKGFTGQYADAARGWTITVPGYYDPALGQFTSADTVDGLNRYGYVAGNPETATDTTGTGSGQVEMTAVTAISARRQRLVPLTIIVLPSGTSRMKIFTVVGGTFGWLRARGITAAKLANARTVAVSGYTKANGTVVDPYVRQATRVCGKRC